MNEEKDVIVIRDFEDWTEKYRPRTLSQVVGHPTLISGLKDWAESWRQGVPKDKAIILYGKAGIGKTSSAYALANDMKWEVIELNASDQRTAKVIKKIVGPASQTSSFEGKKVKRLIIIDEADNIYGNADRGGERAIIEMIKGTNQPIILIANEYYNMSMGLRNAGKSIRFKSIHGASMVSVLKKIADLEKVICGKGVLERIIDNANGDLRSAINDLQAISQGRKKVELEHVITGERDVKEDIFKVLGKIFKGKDMMDAYRSSFTIDKTPEDLIGWIDENLPIEYPVPADLDRAYYFLSRASTFLGRVRRRQNYDMWRYAGILMTAGITVSKTVEYKGYTKFQVPSYWKSLGQKKVARSIRDSLAQKIGLHCHVSKGFARIELIPFFRMLLEEDIENAKKKGGVGGESAVNIVALLGLNVEEIEYLGVSPDIAQKIYDASRLVIEEDTKHNIEIFGGFGKTDKLDEIDENETDEIDKEVKKREKESSDTGQSTLFDF